MARQFPAESAKHARQLALQREHLLRLVRPTCRPFGEWGGCSGNGLEGVVIVLRVLFFVS
jgi:hypothetical protein